MKYLETDGENKDFIVLCHELDNYLNEIAGGEENRTQYIPYNKLDDIHDVILIYDQDNVVGCASFKRYNEICAEVKRVYIRPEYRKKGLAKELLTHLEERARKKGYQWFLLESGEPLVSAMACYRTMGYTVISNYGQYINMKDSICMRKKL